jgi:cell division protein FtsL
MSEKKKDSNRQSKKEQRRHRFWLTEAQAALSWGIILALGALLGTIYLYQASRIAGVGRHVQELQNELDNVKRVNAELEREIAEGQSLERLQSEAERLGFVRARPEDIEYLVIPDYPTAVSQITAPPAPEPPPPMETIWEALVRAFQSSVNNLVRGESP